MPQIFRLGDADCHARAAEVFEDVRAEIAALLPGAEVLHVGGTAIPGMPTKGDLDVQVRVRREDFEEAARRLTTRFSIYDEAFRPPNGQSFTRDDIGVHLTVAGSEDDFQWLVNAILLEDPALVTELAALKRRFDGHDMDVYRQGKRAFYESLLAHPHAERRRAERPQPGALDEPGE